LTHTGAAFISDKSARGSAIKQRPERIAQMTKSRMETFAAQMAAKPAVESKQFSDRAEARAFAEERRAAGFRVRETTRFNGRDMKTKKKFSVNVVHVFERAA